jgi:hypothetical protein
VGEFGVGPTRSASFLVLEFCLYALGALAAVPTLILILILILMIIDFVGRRRDRS